MDISMDQFGEVEARFEKLKKQGYKVVRQEMPVVTHGNTQSMRVFFNANRNGFRTISAIVNVFMDVTEAA